VPDRPQRVPDWLRVKIGKATHAQPTGALLARHGVETVCRNARCPNIGECYSCGTATFLLMGARCTRSCTFCAVESAAPEALDPTEPGRVANAAHELGLHHVVLTSVTRDDLPDGGAGHFAATVRAVRARMPESTVEVLVPDFGGSEGSVRIVLEPRVDVFNHNIETVPRLYASVRPQADYARSLGLLACAKRLAPATLTKSGLMVGLGETREEVTEVLHDLRTHDCEALTIGQYLQPTRRHHPVERYVAPAEFEELAREAAGLGFRHVASSPFVRSSYRAHEAVGG
jgi:lipoyl synthase